MDSSVIAKLMLAKKRAGRPFCLAVTGVSMEPLLKEGDQITVSPVTPPKIGDVLVFLYKEDALLVHRLLKTGGGKYFCKGDNAFRLEDFSPERLIGTVTAAQRNGNPLNFALPETLLTLSYQVNRVFRASGYAVEAAKESAVYQQYAAQMSVYLDCEIKERTCIEYGAVQEK